MGLVGHGIPSETLGLDGKVGGSGEDDGVDIRLIQNILLFDKNTTAYHHHHHSQPPFETDYKYLPNVSQIPQSVSQALLSPTLYVVPSVLTTVRVMYKDRSIVRIDRQR